MAFNVLNWNMGIVRKRGSRSSKGVKCVVMRIQTQGHISCGQAFSDLSVSEGLPARLCFNLEGRMTCRHRIDCRQGPQGSERTDDFFL